MFRTYVAMGLMALGVFSYAQYSGLSMFATEESKPVPGQRSAVHK
jgi:hypothetical protein